MANTFRESGRTSSGIMGFIIRLVVGAIVLAVTAFLTPGFTISGIYSLMIAALVIAVLDFACSKLFKVDASPFGRGLTGFILAAVLIYAAKFFVAGYNVTFMAAIIAALVYGVIDAVIPGRGL